VVFFGENVPNARVETAWKMLAEAEVLLVVGSSLAVFSGFRFVEKAAREHKPIAIVNMGKTRGDDAAAVRIEGRLGEVLPSLLVLLEAGRIRKE
jgi:NAD-dependent SIR2 family protein deacetylase